MGKTEAALTMQRAYRGYYGRQAWMKKLKLFTRAALKLQGGCYGMRSCKATRAKRKFLDHTCTQIQRVWRGCRGRKFGKVWLIWRGLAAKRLQRAWRIKYAYIVKRRIA